MITGILGNGDVIGDALVMKLHKSLDGTISIIASRFSFLSLGNMGLGSG